MPSIGIEQTGLVVGGMVIILIIAGVTLSSSGGFDSFLDWFSGFGETEGERACSSLGGEWCSGFYECNPSQVIENTKGYEGDWKCCEKGECISVSVARFVNNMKSDEVAGMEITEFSLQEGPEVTNLNEMASGINYVEIEYGADKSHKLTFSISYPDKEFAYELSTGGDYCLSSGTATDHVSKRANLVLGKEDMVIELSAWDPDSPASKNVRRVVIRRVNPHEDGIVVSNEQFKAEVMDSDSDMFYVFGFGPSVEQITEDNSFTLHKSSSLIRGDTAKFLSASDFEDKCKEGCDGNEQCIWSWVRENDGSTNIGLVSGDSYTCMMCVCETSAICDPEDFSFEKLEQTCHTYCEKAGKCSSSEIRVQKGQNSACSFNCYYSIIVPKDIRIEKTGDSYRLSYHNGVSWRDMGCSFSKSEIKETLKETLDEECRGWEDKLSD